MGVSIAKDDGGGEDDGREPAYDPAVEPALSRILRTEREGTVRGGKGLIPAYHPVLMETPDLSLAQLGSGADLVPEDMRRDWRDGLFLPRVMFELEETLGTLPFVAGFAQGDMLMQWARPPEADASDAEETPVRRAIPRLSVGGPALVEARFSESKEAPHPAASVRETEELPVVTGVIDDGLPVALDRLCSGDRAAPRTRVALLHVQGSSLFDGRDIEGDAIDTAMAANVHDGRVDEDAVYRELGLRDYRDGEAPLLDHRQTHGAAILDLAAGAAPFGAADRDDAPVIAVQLPGSLVGDPTSGRLFVHAFLALATILVRSLRWRRNGRAAPVVVNLSFANLAGPHDGSALFERAADRLIRLWRKRVGPVDLVLGAGNHRLARCHASIALTEAEPVRTLPLAVQPDDRTETGIEFWFEGARAHDLRLRVHPPGAAAPSPWMGGGDAFRHIEAPGRGRVGRIERLKAASGRRGILVGLNATALRDGRVEGPAPDHLAPCGRWRVEIEHLGGASLPVEAWVERDDGSLGRRRYGRQARFNDPDYRPVFLLGGAEAEDPSRPAPARTSFVTREGTLSGIATGAEPIVVGGRVERSDVWTPYAASGPTLAANRTGPDIASTSDQSTASPGVLAAGTRSGSAAPLDGTSVAAPAVTRALAREGRAGSLPGRPGIGTLADAGVAADPLRAAEGYLRPVSSDRVPR